MEYFWRYALVRLDGPRTIPSLLTNFRVLDAKLSTTVVVPVADPDTESVMVNSVGDTMV